MSLINDRKSLERVAGEMAFAKGLFYLRKGAVKTIGRKDDDLEGIVQGVDTDPFLVNIRIKGLYDFKKAECSCQFQLGRLCRHAVAVLLHWIQYVDITADIDVSKTILLYEKQLKANLLIEPLPKRELPVVEKSKKNKRPTYLLPAYEFRTSQKPRIQISLSRTAFVTGNPKPIGFKIFVINGKERFNVPNLKLLISSGSKQFNFPSFSSFTPMQQYVLNLINELLIPESSQGKENQPQLRFKRLQWPLYLKVISICEGFELIDNKEEVISVKATQPITLTLKIRLIEIGQWGVTALLKDPLNSARDFSHTQVQQGHPVWIFDENLLIFEPVQEVVTYSFLNDFLNTERILDKNQMPYFISSVLDPIKANCEVLEEGECLKSLQFKTPDLRCRLELDYVKESVKANLLFVYEGQKPYLYEGKELADRFADITSEDNLGWVVRQIDKENAKVQYLVKECHFEWGRNLKVFMLSQMDLILDFIKQKLPILRESMDVYCSKEFEEKLLNQKTITPLINVMGSGIDWFEFNAVYKVEGDDELITHTRLKKLVLDGQSYIRLKKGQVIQIPKEIFDRIEAMTEEFDEKKIHLAKMPFLMGEFNRHGLNTKVDLKILEIYEELKNFQSIEPATIPEVLHGVLRDYQQKGVDWLMFLRKFRFGGVLADEMGLGKTLQALAVLQIEFEQGVKLPNLVICPTTLVWNWQEEIKKFLPHVRVLVLEGNHRRDAFDEINKAQIVITSYSLLRRDIELYKLKSFNYVILDEAQNIKNRTTQNAQVAKMLKSSMRLAMTGTPVENSLMDLWSIFDFLMPNFLGGSEKFRKNYEIPITKSQDKEQLQKLSNRILPFVLRRLKKDVIKDLPPKIEQISYCELEPTQAKIYAEMAAKAREIATKSFNEKGFEKSRMVILTLILRLRQICCHPLIAGVDLGHRSVSGKMELLKETVDELLAGGHKVLIFSQFVQMLKVMEDHLNREKITYAYMDGSSKDRQEEVNRFNNDPSLKVFLLSLKVGGVGLNLTSADTVIIYEPWWNPAVENQAIDRVHRIGQTNSVLAYRLITKGTIEEKMLELQNRKRFLMDSLVLSEDSIGKKLDWEDIKFLLGMK